MDLQVYLENAIIKKKRKAAKKYEASGISVWLSIWLLLQNLQFITKFYKTKTKTQYKCNYKKLHLYELGVKIDLENKTGVNKTFD